MPRLCSSLLLSLLIASSGSAVTMAWTPIGNPGNACDPQSQGCFGAVGYEYSIGTYEVTNAQYVEFLNAKAASDPLALYNTSMGSWGITRAGDSGSYTYSPISGRENRPVIFVSFYDALRFANWLSNGQGSGDTETGAYTLLGGTAVPSNDTSVTRSAGAAIFLTSENEWYKAAYYSPAGVYFDYPAGSDTQTTCSTPTATANRANCGSVMSSHTSVGSYPGSPSPYGSYDQGGSVYEWNETLTGGSGRGYRGGSFGSSPLSLAASSRAGLVPSWEDNSQGFRLVLIPEPGTGLLVIAGLVGIAVRRRMSA